jgi:hypothetical protein
MNCPRATTQLINWTLSWTNALAYFAEASAMKKKCDVHLKSDERWLESFADEAESLPNGFSTMTRVQPVLAMVATFCCQRYKTFFPVTWAK